MLDMFRRLLGHRYAHPEPETPNTEQCDADKCEQLEARRRLHEATDRVNILLAEASLFERDRDDDKRNAH